MSDKHSVEVKWGNQDLVVYRNANERAAYGVNLWGVVKGDHLLMAGLDRQYLDLWVDMETKAGRGEGLLVVELRCARVGWRTPILPGP
jgi:hypothetical protein